MCDPNLLNNTKSVLSYLVKNGPTIQTINSLSLDFYNYTQVQIPFFELGYSFLLTFLRSIPDVLQIDPVTLHVRPAGTFYQSDSRNRSQFIRTPMTFPIVLPWTQPYRQEIIESTANIPISLLGPRSHGDGRCSSLDSISTENEMKSHEKFQQDQTATTAFVSNNDSTNDFDLDVDVIKYYKIADKKVVRFDLTPINDEPIADFHDDSEKLQKSMSINSLDIIKFDTTPPLHSPEKFNYDVDDDLFSPKEKVTKSTADDDAIPFMFDDKINLLSSCFFNGEYGCMFETTNINDIMTVGNIYELYVSEVNSPFKFWFQLNEEVPNPVEELQERLHECYSLTGIPELIKREHLVQGYACAALYAKMWHRGQIIGDVHDEKVSIFFVDYGTVDRVNIKDVRYLLSSFSTQPKLCHRGTLDFIKPRNTNQRWTVEATSFLISLVENRRLTAGITEIDSKNNSVRLYLIDTDANVNVNCSMVYNCFAYPEDPRDRYQNHIADVVPTFEELETSQHEPFSKVVELLEQNYDYEELLHKSIVEEFDFYIPTHVTEKEAEEQMEKFMARKEEGQKRAKKRDAKIFLEIFKNILKNPFLNPRFQNEIAVNATNPFSD